MKKADTYSERYNEMRRFRDYELTASTWYSAILLAILGFIISEKFHYKSFLANLLSTNTIVQIFVAIAVTLIGFFCIYSVCYVSYRYQELRNYVTIFMEPNTFSNIFEPEKFYFQPRDAIFYTQIILIGATNFVLFAPPACIGIIAFVISVTPLYITRRIFRHWEIERKEKMEEEKRKEIEEEKQKKEKKRKKNVLQ